MSFWGSQAAGAAEDSAGHRMWPSEKELCNALGHRFSVLCRCWLLEQMEVANLDHCVRQTAVWASHPCSLPRVPAPSPRFFPASCPSPRCRRRQVCHLRQPRQALHAGAHLRRVQLRQLCGALRDLRRHGGVRCLLLQGVHTTGEGCELGEPGRSWCCAVPVGSTAGHLHGSTW